VIGGILISESLAPGNWNWVPGNEFRSSNPAVVDYCSMNFFRGGPKAPREQCAVQLAMAKALAPWLTEQHKIGTASPSSE